MKLLAALFCLSAAAAQAGPIDWRLQVDAFDNVFRPHPYCATGRMSEVECSNFRARALKRFQKEWESNAYWRDGKLVANPAADRRVNSELPKERRDRRLS